MGVRGRLFLVSAVAIVIGGAITAVMFERGLDRWLTQRTTDELFRQARAVREVLLAEPGWPRSAELQAMADRLGEALGRRVTVILGDGTVAGDSEVTAERLGGLEHHGDRPEVREALASGEGVARRHSTTLQREMLYVALRFDTPRQTGVVRMAEPLASLEQAVWSARALATGAVLAGLVLAMVMSALASHLFTRWLHRLLDGVRALARGDGTWPPVATGAGFGQLADSAQRLGERLRRTVDELSHERDRFEQVLDTLTSVVMVIDTAGRISLVNAAARRLLRIDGSPGGRLLLDAIRAPGVAELLERAATGSAATEIELPGPPAVKMIARVVPLAGDSRLVVMDDVTERRRLETMRRDFVANVSHELRTPVSVILASSETLLDGDVSDTDAGTQRRFLGAIHSNAQRLSRLIADLLDLSRIEAGRFGIELQRVPVRRAFERALEGVRSEAERKGHRLALAVPPGLSVRADGQALDQVMLNLVDNAVKYTPSGGRIVLAARLEGGRVRIEVQDDGPGIEPRHQQRVFERFYRVDPGRSREMGGTGLGLAIVKHLVESMGGRVGVEPASPRGSCFWVELERDPGGESAVESPRATGG